MDKKRIQEIKERLQATTPGAEEHHVFVGVPGMPFKSRCVKCDAEVEWNQVRFCGITIPKCLA